MTGRFDEYLARYAFNKWRYFLDDIQYGKDSDNPLGIVCDNASMISIIQGYVECAFILPIATNEDVL